MLSSVRRFSTAAAKVVHDALGKQFYLKIGDKKAVIDYRIEPNDIKNFYHIEVPQEFRGQSYTRDLAEYAFAYALQNSWKVRPTCPYLKNKFLPSTADKFTKIVEA